MQYLQPIFLVNNAQIKDSSVQKVFTFHIRVNLYYYIIIIYDIEIK